MYFLKKFTVVNKHKIIQSLYFSLMHFAMSKPHSPLIYTTRF